MLRKVQRLPATGLTKQDAERGRYIVAHSETGHHHTVAAAGVEYFQSEDPLVAYLVVSQQTQLLHERSFDTHAPIAVPPGTYEVRRQRERTPEGWRQVVD